jgi:hypothetical protein
MASDLDRRNSVAKIFQPANAKSLFCDFLPDWSCAGCP